MKKSSSKKRLVELMDYYGITQAELCKRSGIKSSAMSNYIKGDREPRQDKISQIADAFGVDPTWLMGYDVPMKRETTITDRIMAYVVKLTELPQEKQEFIFNQIDYLRENTNENYR